MRHDANRNTQPEVWREMEADEGQGAGGNHGDHGPGDAKAHGERRGERRTGDRSQAGDSRVEADHRSRMAARFQDDAEQRHAEANGDADDADRRDRRHHWQPVYAFVALWLGIDRHGMLNTLSL